MPNRLFIEGSPVCGPSVWLGGSSVCLAKKGQWAKGSILPTAVPVRRPMSNPPNQTTSPLILLNSLMWQPQKWKGSWTGQVSLNLPRELDQP